LLVKFPCPIWFSFILFAFESNMSRYQSQKKRKSNKRHKLNWWGFSLNERKILFIFKFFMLIWLYGHNMKLYGCQPSIWLWKQIFWNSFSKVDLTLGSDASPRYGKIYGVLIYLIFLSGYSVSTQSVLWMLFKCTCLNLREQNSYSLSIISRSFDLIFVTTK
jgi:hypothetical protein